MVIYKKFDAQGNSIRFKAQLIARGFTQIPGVDYRETFSPTLKLTSLRLIFAITAYLNLELHHVDIETTFLHEDLKEDIYMEQPPILQDSAHPDYECKLHKPLYGLKQSPRQWYAKLHNFLLHKGFMQLQSEPTLYIRKQDSNFLLLGVYVDDLPIVGTSRHDILQFVKELQTSFPTKHLGELEYFLGLEVKCNRNTRILSISQNKLVDGILQKFDMMDCSSIATPLTIPCHLSSSDSPSTPEEVAFMKNIPYRQILGSLRYLVSCTRPDLSFSTGFLSRFMEHPGPRHWEALKRVLRYLKYTRDMTLSYKALPAFSKGGMVAPLHGWTDADWGGDKDTSRSTSGYLFTFSGGAITWKTKKQSTVALSSTEAEYIAATLVAKEGLWLKSIFDELNIIHINEFQLWCDNKSCITIARNPKITDQNKHIRARYHFLCELFEDGTIRLDYTPTLHMWADFLTKLVPVVKHWSCCQHVGLKCGARVTGGC